MVVRAGWFGGVCNAYCQCRDVLLDAGNIDAYLIGLAGGAAGQARHLITHQGVGRWGARSRSDGNAGWDRAQFRQARPGARVADVLGDGGHGRRPDHRLPLGPA
jgi:hypothetical protein